MSFSQELNYAAHLVKEAAQIYIQLGKAPTNIYIKDEYDTVTSTDYAVEQFIISQLSNKFPTDKIISEEQKIETITDARTWVLDPIDGTTNYSRKIPIYGIQIALLVKKSPVVAAIYLPEVDELYYAAIEQGAYLNSSRIEVNSSVNLNQAIISMGDFSKTKNRIEENKIRLSGINSIANHAARIKMWGAACYDLAFLAAGRTDAYLVYSYYIWDIMPGYLIAKEAGAVFSQLNGQPFNYNAKTLIGAANNELMNNLLKLISGN